MRTLWVGILEPDVLCYSAHGSAIIEEMRRGHAFTIGEHIEVGAVTRNNGELRGFGIVVAQSSDLSAEFSHNTHEQYLWLVEGWLLGHGIGPKDAIQYFTEDADQLPEVPERWK